MLKKSLIFGSIVLLIVMLFALAGCEGPVGPAGQSGETPKIPEPIPGEDGKPGSGSLSAATVTAELLEEAFQYNGVVTLEPTVTRVSGVVPAGNKLVVFTGGILAVGSTLDVESGATLTISKNATLEADGVGSGLLTPHPEAKIEGAGALILPYDISGTWDGVSYGSEEIEGVAQYVGSTSTKGKAPVALTSDNIAAIFTEVGEDELTVQDIAGLTTDAIPEGKTLTLMGTGNTTTGAFNLADGNLVVTKNARLQVIAASMLEAGGTIRNEGTIALGAVSLQEGGGDITNNGTITTSTVDVSALERLLLFDGTGKIEASGSVGPLTASVKLTQQLHIMSGSIIALYPNGDNPVGTPITEKKIFIKSGGRLNLGATSKTVGTLVQNDGTIGTAATTTEMLKGIFESMENKGTVEATAAVTTLAGPLDIPEGVTLKLTNAGSTFGTGTGGTVTVNGTLSLANGVVAFSPAGDVILKDGAILDIDGTGLFTTNTTANRKLIINSGAVLTGTGKITASANGALFIQETEGTGPEIPTYGVDTAATGIVCNNFQPAKSVINAVQTTFEKLKTYNSGTYTIADTKPYIGIVHFAAVNTATLIALDEGWKTGPEFNFSVPGSPSTLDVSTTHPGANGPSLVVKSTSGVNIGQFTLTVSGGALCLTDSGYTGSVAKYDALEFTTVRFKDRGLIGPALKTFCIGIGTNRAS